VIVYFYPAAMTSGCTTQACDFSDSLDALQAAGVSVLGISPTPPDRLAEFRERDGLTITLLSDPDRQVLTRWGAFGEKKSYGKTVVGVIRSTLVVGRRREGSRRRCTTSRQPVMWPGSARSSPSDPD
jgi:peroxiredoxin Q/BCP